MLMEYHYTARNIYDKKQGNRGGKGTDLLLKSVCGEQNS
jgi:hypothetical protein